MRNRSNIDFLYSVISRGEFLFVLFCLLPSLANAGNGSLGTSSTGSTQLTIVIPEHFQTESFVVDQGKVSTCGYFSGDISFLSISGSSIQKLQMQKDESHCKDGQTFITPITSNGVSIFVPSSAS